MRPIIKLNSFSAVQPGQTANLVLDPGVTYDQIYIKAASVSHIEKVTLKLNAEEIFSLTPDEIYGILFRKDRIMATERWVADYLYDQYGGEVSRVSTDSDRLGKILPLPLQLLDSLYDGTQRLTGLVLGPGDNCVLDVKLKYNINDYPTLDAYAETRAFPGARQLVRKFERYTVPIAAAGQVNFTSMKRGSRVLLVYFKPTNGAKIEALEVLRDNVKIWEADQSDNELINWIYGASRTTEANAGFDYVLDCVREGFPLKDAMSTASNSLNFKITSSGADNIEIIVERLEPMARTWQTSATTAKKSRKTVGR